MLTPMEFTMSTASKRTRRNNTDPESTRQEILQAALEVLAKDGRESLSVSEVARRAGVNRGTAYQHFPTREDLAHATAKWVSERMYEEFYGDAEVMRQRNEPYPPELAQQRLSSFAMKNPELSQAWLFDVMTTEGEVTDRFWKEYVDQLQEFVDQGYGRKDIDVEVFAFTTLVSSLMWPIWVGAHSKGGKSRKKMQNRFTDEMMRLVLFGSLVPEHHADLIKMYE
ncbi:MAG: AcrR family transcriptional regulator [Halieaceae bacterium]